MVAGSSLPLLDMRDYASTRSKVVPGHSRLVPAVMNKDTNKCILPSIPRLAQTKVIDGEPLCRFPAETVSVAWNLTFQLNINLMDTSMLTSPRQHVCIM